MKPILQKRFAFIAKSMLWSMLLYVILMLAFNWDDVSNKVRGNNPITVISNIPSPEIAVPVANNPISSHSSIAHNVSAVRKIITLAKSISNIFGITPR